MQVTEEQAKSMVCHRTRTVVVVDSEMKLGERYCCGTKCMAFKKVQPTAKRISNVQLPTEYIENNLWYCGLVDQTLNYKLQR